MHLFFGCRAATAVWDLDGWQLLAFRSTAVWWRPTMHLADCRPHCLVEDLGCTKRNGVLIQLQCKLHPSRTSSDLTHGFVRSENLNTHVKPSTHFETDYVGAGGQKRVAVDQTKAGRSERAGPDRMGH